MPKIDQQPVPAEAKGVPPVMTSKPEPIGYVAGKPVFPLIGGCDQNTFCDDADPSLKTVIRMRSGKPSKEPTEEHQEIYRQLRDEKHVKITGGHAELVFTVPDDWQDMP